MVIITETWLNSDISNSCVVGDCNFSVFRADRISISTEHKRGGGVCILTNNSTVRAVSVPLPVNFAHCELCVIDLVPDNNDTNIRVFALYRPPGPNRDTELLKCTDDLCSCIDVMFKPQCTNILCGDFNFPDVNWSINNSLKCNNFTSDGLFLTLFYKYGLEQLVQQATRTDNTLDLIFTNDSNSVVNVDVSAPFSNSDHSIVSFYLFYDRKFLNNCLADRFIFDFYRADWNAINFYLLNFNYDDIFYSNMPLDDVFNAFYAILHNCIEQYVPVKRISAYHVRPGKRYPFSIKRLIHKKAVAWRQYRSRRTVTSRAYYNRIAAKCRRSIRLFTATCEERLVDRGNIAAFYRHANKKFASKSSIGPLKDSNSLLVTDSAAKAELLNSTFVSYFVKDNGLLPSKSGIVAPLTSIHTVNFTTTQIHRAIKKLKANSSGGPDGIPPIFYKRCSSAIVYPLSLLFTLSFNNSFIPPEWHHSYVTPIYKKGDKTDPSNYRPISLTCTICKLMESVIKEQMMSYLLENNIITKHQHAFITNCSTASNLLECTHDWQMSLNTKNTTDVAYIDFSRAFDSIVFSKLIFKLQCYGISAKLLKWIECFLYNRFQCVVIDGKFSPVASVDSGVPQGSVLGPLLFLLFINDIDSVCSANTVLQLFADDCKLYSVTTILSSSISLQCSLDKLSAWADLWQLAINILKCFVLSISSNRNVPRHLYFINGNCLLNCNNAVDLGIKISTNMSFKLHIDGIVSKAYQRLAILFRGFVTRRSDFMRKIYVTYVRPILEYNSVVWSPTEIYLIDLLESVQRYFTRNVPSVAHLSYLDRLSTLNLESLEIRRLKSDMVYYYKIFSGLTPHSADRLFITYFPPPSSRSSSSYLIKPRNASEKCLSFLTYRNVAAWNSLPDSLKSTNSVTSFRNGIQQINFNRFLNGSAYK